VIGAKMKNNLMRDFKIFKDPLRLVTFSFLINIILGALLLSLPGMTTRNVPFTDLLFTSTSAVCVTGLTTLDISQVFTVWGKIVVCILIQLGGLGIITLWLFLLSTFGSLIGNAYTLASSTVGERSVNRIGRILMSVAYGTFIIESFGAVLLYFGLPEHTTFWNDAGWALFHSVSAFCNAGFSLQSDNLMGYGDNFVINFTIMLLIIIGGFGYGVMAELTSLKKRFSLHTLLVFFTTLFLVMGGFFVLGVLEWDGSTFGNAGIGSRLLRLLFLSVTPRTAGFNTLDISMLRDSSLFFIILLMLIGASPGGTGGGFKTTPLAIVFLRLISILSGRRYVRIQRWDIEDETIFKAVWIIFVYLLIAAVASLLLLISESDLPRELNPHGALGIIFEAVSALGTVGLSTGITSYVSFIGKCILIFAMFIGRIGPLTFAFAIGGRAQTSSVKFVEGKVGLG